MNKYMQNSLSLNNSITIFNSISKKLTFQKKFSLRFIIISNILLIIFLLIFYVFQINSVIKESYLIENYHQKIKSLSEENKNLEITFSHLDSLSNIENLVAGLNFEQTDTIHYIQADQSYIAKANKINE